MPVRTLEESFELEEGIFRSDEAQGFLSSAGAVGYAELEEAVAGIANYEPAERNRERDYTIMPTEEKIVLNNLGNASRNTIYDEICYFKFVEEFIRKRNAVCPGFKDRLVSCFRDQWHSLERQLITGDRAFDTIYDRLAQGLATPGAKRALHMIMVLVFEKCDILKRTPQEEAERVVAT